MPTVLRMLFCLIALLIFSGCAEKNRPLRVLWPVPPEEPKLEFVGVYYSELDFNKEAKGKITAMLVGSNNINSFKSPFGIASNGEGVVYVSDLHLNNIRTFDFNKETVGFLSSSRQFRTPLDLNVDSRGQIYVADGSESVVKVLAPTGIVEKKIGNKDLLTNPAYLAINEKLGRIYVSDSKGHRIAVFNMEGEHLFSFGERGGEPGQFFSPQGLAVRKSDDSIFVADRMNARIQVFDKDGNFLRQFGERGSRWYQFEAPKDLAFDSDENLYIIDQRRSSIYTYSPEGEILLVTGGDPSEAGPLSFASPSSIYIDSKDRIYVADTIFKRFTVWQYLSRDYLEENPITPEDLERIKEQITKNANHRSH